MRCGIPIHGAKKCASSSKHADRLVDRPTGTVTSAQSSVGITLTLDVVIPRFFSCRFSAPSSAAITPTFDVVMPRASRSESSGMLGTREVVMPRAGRVERGAARTPAERERERARVRVGRRIVL